MIRRKDTFGYIDLVRGKYHPQNLFQVQSIIDQLSMDEKNRILHCSQFNELWQHMWGGSDSHHTSAEEANAARKFQQLQQGVEGDDGCLYTLAMLVAQSRTQWAESEWEFPKGRRNPKEKDVDCALRECAEETGIPPSSLDLLENVMPMEEIFVGTNLKSYKHKYFVAFCSHHAALDAFQRSEVSRLEWKTLDQCLASIRSYHLEKKEVVLQVHALLQEHAPVYAT